MNIIIIIIIITLILCCCCCLSSSSGYYFFTQSAPEAPEAPSAPSLPTTKAPTTQAPTIQAPTIQAPTTQEPTTQAPTTLNNADSKKAAEAEDAKNLINLIKSIEKYKIKEEKLIAARSIILQPGSPFRIFMQMDQATIDIDGRKITFNQATNELMNIYQEFFRQWDNKYIFEINISLDENPANNKSYLDIIKKKALNNTLKKATPEYLAANKKQVQTI
jgi:hypothetical protein